MPRKVTLVDTLVDSKEEHGATGPIESEVVSSEISIPGVDESTCSEEHWTEMEGSPGAGLRSEKHIEGGSGINDSRAAVVGMGVGTQSN